MSLGGGLACDGTRVVKRVEDELVGERSNLLLLNLIIGKLLLVLLPVLARGAGHGEGCVVVLRWMSMSGAARSRKAQLVQDVGSIR